MGPINRLAHARFVVSTRRHVFTTDVTRDMVEHNFPLVLPTTVNNFLLGSKKVFPVSRGYAKCNHWEITIHDGLPCLREPWFQYIFENNLMPGDEVMFFFRFDKHVWEILFKQEISWDEDLCT
ncbi:hypothetical protein HKD37_20G056583 [Glycine soja]